MDEANERTCTKYQGLVDESKRHGWKTHCLMSGSGLLGICRVVQVLGLTGQED